MNMTKEFDRAAEDLGNSIHFEHVNVQVPDQRLAALFYVTFWAAGRMKMPLPKNVAAHYERMKARPAVKRTLEQEGLSAAA